MKQNTIKTRNKIILLALALLMVLAVFVSLTLGTNQNHAQANTQEAQATSSAPIFTEIFTENGNPWQYSISRRTPQANDNNTVANLAAIFNTSYAPMPFARHNIGLEIFSVSDNFALWHNDGLYSFRRLYVVGQFETGHARSFHQGAIDTPFPDFLSPLSLFLNNGQRESFSLFVLAYHHFTAAFQDPYFRFDIFDVNITPIVQLPPDPTKDGFTFVGWYFDSAFTIAYDGRPITNDTQLHARFTPIEFDTIFHTNGGRLDESTFIGTMENRIYRWFPFTILCPDIRLPEAENYPNRVGYYFRGWYRSADFSCDPVTYIATGTTGTQTFFARWSLEEWETIYHLNGGTLATPIPQFFDRYSPLFMLPTPTKAGFRFLGWFMYDAPHSAEFHYLPRQAGTPFAWITPIEARWEIINFNIIFNLAGGTNPVGTINSFTIECGDLVLPTPTRFGHRFLGWWSNASFFGDSVRHIQAGSTGNRTVFARWERIMVQVTFFVNGEIFSELTVAYGTMLKDFHFLNGSGLQVDIFADSGLLREFDPSEGIKVDTDLFAVRPFSIYARLSMNINGEITYEMLLVNSQLDNLTRPTISGYEFMGWYHDRNFTRPVFSTDRISGNATIYARFAPITPPSRMWILWLVLSLTGAVGVVVAVMVIRKRRKK